MEKGHNDMVKWSFALYKRLAASITENGKLTKERDTAIKEWKNAEDEIRDLNEEKDDLRKEWKASEKARSVLEDDMRICGNFSMSGICKLTTKRGRNGSKEA